MAGRQFGGSFVTMALAEAFRASLITAARKGEGFDTESGLPESMERTRRDISFYEHAPNSPPRRGPRPRLRPACPSSKP